MKSKAAIALTLSFLAAASVRAERISLVGATVINPCDGKVLPNATVVIDGDKIERVSMGKQDAAGLGAVNARRQHSSAPPARSARPSGIDSVSAQRSNSALA